MVEKVSNDMGMKVSSRQGERAERGGVLEETGAKL